MRRAATFLLCVLALAAARPAQAQACYPREALVEGLKEKYGEVLRVQAMTATGRLVEIFVAPGGGWTLLLSRPDGVSCPVFSGRGVDIIAAPGEGDPA